MRILFVPMYTNASIGNCTTYIYAKNLLRRIVEQDPNAYVYLPIPKSVRDFAYEEVRHDRIKLLTVDLTTNQLQGMVTPCEDLIALFNDRDGRFFADAILTTAPPTVAQMRPRIHVQRDGWSIEPVWASFVMFGMGEKTPLPEGYKLQQAVGLLSSDLTVWQSDASYQRVMTSCRKILSGSANAQIMRSKVGGAPITAVPVARLDALDKLEKPRDEYVVNYGYSLHNVYNYKEIFEVFDTLFCAGNKVRVLATTSSGGFVLTSPKWQEIFDKRYKRYFDFSWRLPQQEFWRRASQAHAFLFLAQDVESSFSVLEQFMLGMVGVLKEIPYTKECTYPGYPFLARSHLEAATMLRYVLENYFDDKIQDVLKRQQDFIREHFDIAKVSDTIHRSVKDAVARRHLEQEPSEDVVVLLKRIFKGQDRVEWAQFAEQIKSRSRNGIDVERTAEGSRGRSYWRWAMQRAGWLDDCSGPMPVFVRGTAKEEAA